MSTCFMDSPNKDFQMIHMSFIRLHFAQVLSYFPATYTIFCIQSQITFYPKWFPKKSRILNYVKSHDIQKHYIKITLYVILKVWQILFRELLMDHWSFKIQSIRFFELITVYVVGKWPLWRLAKKWKQPLFIFGGWCWGCHRA